MAALTLAVSTAVGMGAVMAPSQAAPSQTTAGTTACSTNWGSWAKSKPTYSWSQVLRVRAGRHTCYDRMVVDLRGTLRGYDVRYAPVYTEGQGTRVWLRGAADLRVIVRGPAYDSTGRPTYDPHPRLNAVDVTGFRTFRQIAFAGSFEGQTTFGVGTRARLPMRAFILRTDGGSRLVVDVAHTW
ncbi:MULTISPECIES: AMIN-like domain-containing (lipo)protein [unclassified Janibacter]|uniref:AMIN-like domain-containing (lipo)protein n=1 Tax=unclassified Janibacter TaxID=2649294 RepID=UPI003D074ACD